MNNYSYLDNIRYVDIISVADKADENQTVNSFVKNG